MNNDFVAISLTVLIVSGAWLIVSGAFSLGVRGANLNLREEVKLCIEGHKPSCDKLEEMFRIKEWVKCPKVL